MEQGLYDKAVDLYTKVWTTRKRVLGPDHPETLISGSCLAATYSALGRYSDSAQLNLEVYEVRKRVSGPEHPDTLTVRLFSHLTMQVLQSLTPCVGVS